MKKQVVNTKYQFTPDYGVSGIDYTELITVPDQVLSMYDIYMKYAVRGDIAGLANNIRPHTTDDLDLDDPELDFDYDDDVDVLQRARMLRMRQPYQAHPASEDIPSDKKEDSDESSRKPQTNAGDESALDEGSE